MFLSQSGRHSVVNSKYKDYIMSRSGIHHVLWIRIGSVANVSDGVSLKLCRGWYDNINNQKLKHKPSKSGLSKASKLAIISKVL